MTCAVSHGNLFRHVHVICFAMSQKKNTTTKQQTKLKTIIHFN